jgi:predicted transport protein
MKAGIKEKTGKPLDHWVELVRASGREKHGEQMKLLKDEHGITHGYANFICQAAKGRLDASDDDLLAGQYAGKDHLKAIYDALETFARTLGDDVEIAPKKTSVAFRRSKNFAVIMPATKTRIDLGLNLKGETGTLRLIEEKPGKMCTHKMKLQAAEEVDDEVKAWMREAYGRA